MYQPEEVVRRGEAKGPKGDGGAARQEDTGIRVEGAPKGDEEAACQEDTGITLPVSHGLLELGEPRVSGAHLPPEVGLDDHADLRSGIIGYEIA